MYLFTCLLQINMHSWVLWSLVIVNLVNASVFALIGRITALFAVLYIYKRIKSAHLYFRWVKVGLELRIVVTGYSVDSLFTSYAVSILNYLRNRPWKEEWSCDPFHLFLNYSLHADLLFLTASCDGCVAVSESVDRNYLASHSDSSIIKISCLPKHWASFFSVNWTLKNYEVLASEGVQINWCLHACCHFSTLSRYQSNQHITEARNSSKTQRRTQVMTLKDRIQFTVYCSWIQVYFCQQVGNTNQHCLKKEAVDIINQSPH